MAKTKDELTEQREQTGTGSRSAESRRKKAESQQPQQTMEDYLLAQLNEEVILKDGTQLKAADGHVMTKQVRSPFTQGGGSRRGCGKMVGHLGKILAKKSVQVWPIVN